MNDSDSDGDALTLGKGRILGAAVLFAASTVSKVTVHGVEMSGGATLAGLGALVLLWPVFKMLMLKGGTTEFLGIKLQLSNLERRTESDLALRLEGLRADLEELRQTASGAPKPEIDGQPTIAAAVDDRVFREAVAAYRENQDFDRWRARVNIDKRLASGGGRLPLRFLQQVLSGNDDIETQMAVAVCLGLRYPGDDDVAAAKLLAQLLGSKYERVRYRAAVSVQLRASRSDVSANALVVMKDGVERALMTEPADAVKQVLTEALAVLQGLGPERVESQLN
jgi:hypothetical protein